METPNWFDKSACRKLHGSLWFPPIEGYSEQRLFYDVAVTVCNSCPVWKECLKLGEKEVHGMWGGLTPTERSSYFNKTDKHLARHGSSQRFRQGCSCNECSVAHTKNFEKIINKSLYPSAGKPFTDIENVHKMMFGKSNEVN